MSGKVLLAVQDPSLQNVYTKLLRRAWHITIANSYDEICQQLQTQHFSVLVCDLALDDGEIRHHLPQIQSFLNAQQTGLVLICPFSDPCDVCEVCSGLNASCTTTRPVALRELATLVGQVATQGAHLT
ncbi:MAG: hypothetical protein D6712_16420 [Chloroflexi bacterium]|nr:MAG: hypothetical protein D6712_16420 [Chloroflexota bacterium]